MGQIVSKKSILDTGSIPVWVDVVRQKTAGGVVDISGMEGVVKAGTPMYLGAMGGEAKIMKTFRLAKNLGASDTAIHFESGYFAIEEGMILCVAPSTLNGTATGVALGAVSVDASTGNLVAVISANAFGVQAAGTVFAVATAAGANKSLAVKANGLLWHDIVCGEDGKATAAIVTDGVILEDRICPIPECVKAAINVTFETES